MDCTQCIHEAELAELKRDMERNSQQHREFYNNFAKLEKDLAVSEERYNNLLSIMNEVKNTVNELKERPAKKWDSVTMCAITAVISGIIGYLVSVLF